MTEEDFTYVMVIETERRPFRVFTIELKYGKRLEVDHPQAIMWIDGLAQYTAPGDFGVWFDHESVSSIIQAGSDAEFGRRKP
jgi:hypothetical protein